MEDIVLDVGSEIHAGLTPWYPLDLASSARILVWKVHIFVNLVSMFFNNKYTKSTY